MDLSTPETWRWIWAVVAVSFGIGEMLMPGSFFLLPFAIGAIVALVAAFAGAVVWLQWAIFIVASGICLAVLVPIGRRLNQRPTDEGVGVKRLVGKEAQVTESIEEGPTGAGEVRIEREIWRAGSADQKRIDAGVVVRVVSVEGTRVMVRPIPREESQTGPLDQAELGAVE